MTEQERSPTFKSSNIKTKLRIVDLPYKVRQQLCDHIDSLNVWTKLAEDMQLSSIQIAKISRNKQPTVELISFWGDRYHHTVLELFFLLKRRQLFDSMVILKNFVDIQYQRCIPDKTAEPPAARERRVTPIESTPIPVQIARFAAPSPSETTYRKEGGDPEEITSSKIQEYTMPIPNVDFQELCNATNGFHNDQVLGKGGFATVYKGRYKHTDIAIKVLNPLNPNGGKVDIAQTLTEMKYLSGYRHDNIVQLFAVSLNGDKKCLVYELLKGGSLEDQLYHLRNWPALSCLNRFKIIQGIATGINFLHTFCKKPLIHGDIKPGNILLTESLSPKIGDFGLAREGPNAVNEGIQVSHIYGTKFYCAPEVQNRMLSTKLDVYSFGIVLLEMFTGLRIFDNNRKNKELSKHIYDFFATPGNNIQDLVDKKLSLTMHEQRLCENIIRIGYCCIDTSPDKRPDMDHVLPYFEAMQKTY